MMQSPSTNINLFLEHEKATLSLAACLGAAFQQSNKVSRPIVLYLHGELGAGKTCLSRGIIHGLGFPGRVKSPTFTLVEPYHIASVGDLYHFDFYRLHDPEEAMYLGIDDYLHNAFLLLFEWPNKARGYIPPPDIELQLSYKALGRDVNIIANSDLGNACVKILQEKLKSSSDVYLSI